MRVVRNLLTVVALCTGFFVLGCESPFDPAGEAGDAALAKATTTTSSSTLVYNQNHFVSCANDGAGENVNLVGEVSFVVRKTTSDSGNSTIKVRIRTKATGTGDVTGDTYRGKGTEQSSTNVQSDDFPVSISNSSTFKIVAPGADNNLTIKLNVHVTVNNNGDLTSTVADPSITCN